MEKQLYELMDWPEIEAVVYSESQRPKELLGAHRTEHGILVQAFFPEAETVEIVTNKKKHISMEQVDEAGFFAALIPGTKLPSYHYEVFWADGTRRSEEDPYRFPSVYTEQDLKRFAAGIHYEIYEKMGAHPMTLDGVSGVSFSVWAPNAMRVSVVGDFNLWDGRRHQME